MWEKFKSIAQTEQMFLSVVVVLVGVISFGLGRQSLHMPTPVSQSANVQLAPEPFILSSDTTAVRAAEAITSPLEPVDAGRLVASKSGSRYHLPDCPSAKQIKESNKVFFASAAEAEAAGYTKAANCPGL